MKKTLLSVIAMSAVIGTANAAPTTEQRRAMCEDFGDVWVENGEGACIEEHPCESDNPEVRRTYCIEYTFEDFRITERLARRVIEKYFEDDGSVTELKFFKSSNSVGVTYGNGNYAEIKFFYFVPDMEEFNKELDFTGLACASVTKAQPLHNFDGDYVFCPEANNHEICREVYEFGKELGSGRTNAMAIWDDLDKRCKLQPFEW